MYVHTSIIIRIVTHITDKHEKDIFTHIKVCIHKVENSYKCMYTQIKFEKFFDNKDILYIVEKVLKNAILW